jgi:two-component system, sensor histidine kinase and response regulator
MANETPARVLVVDDDESVLITVAGILEAEGYKVTSASNVDTAVDVLERERMDLVLTDIRMEGPSGLSLLTEIRHRWPKTTAVVLTGYASLESAIDALREGAYDYLVKPCDVEELKATVAHAVERGRLERALEERLAELETANKRISGFANEWQRRVDEATSQLSEKVAELSEAKKRLEMVQVHREEFISMVIHEMNQPLTNIAGYAQLLARTKSEDARRDHALRVIVGETQRLGRLLRDLADASRLAVGDFKIAPVACDALEVVGIQIEMAMASTDKHDITFETQLETLPAFWDEDRIAQVVSNLIKNAIVHTQGGVIEVVCESRDGEALIAIADSGPGIPEDRMEVIFEPHVRLPGRQKPMGSGLGLYIARGIVETHGGRIWAENRPGGGVRFTMAVPLRPQVAGANP